MEDIKFNISMKEPSKSRDFQHVEVGAVLGQMPKTAPRQLSLVFNSNKSNRIHLGNMSADHQSQEIHRKPVTAVHSKKRRNQQRYKSMTGGTFSQQQQNINNYLDQKMQSFNVFQTTDTQQSTEMRYNINKSNLNRAAVSRSAINYNKNSQLNSQCWANSPSSKQVFTTTSADKVDFYKVQENNQNLSDSNNLNMSDANNYLRISSNLDNFKYGSVTINNSNIVSKTNSNQSSQQYGPRSMNQTIQIFSDTKTKKEINDNSNQNMLNSENLRSQVTSRQSINTQQVFKTMESVRMLDANQNFNDIKSMVQPLPLSPCLRNSTMTSQRSSNCFGMNSHKRTFSGHNPSNQKKFNLNASLQQMEVRKLSHKINNLKRGLTRYKLDNVGLKRKQQQYPMNVQRIAESTIMPNTEKALSDLPGFKVTTKVHWRHYSKGLVVKPPHQNNQYQLKMESNNQILNKKLGNNFRLRNLKPASGPYYEVVMPQHFYEKQIKDKIQSNLMGKLSQANKVWQARMLEASKPVEKPKKKGTYEDQMIKPPLQFVGTQAETDYLKRLELEQLKNKVPDSPMKLQKKKSETPSEMMSKVFDKEEKFEKRDYNKSMNIENTYNFPKYHQRDHEIPVDRSELIATIQQLIKQMAPNSLHAQNYVKQVQVELTNMNIYDLTKAVHHLRLFKKYESREIESAGIKIEAKHQFSMLKKLGEEDKIEKERKEFMRFAHHFKHHSELHTCQFPIYSHGELLMIDIVYTASMFELKKVVNCCFDPNHDPKNLAPSSRQWTLGQALQRIEQEMSYGPYTNSELIDIASKAFLNAEYLIDLVVPKNKQAHPMLMDTLSQIYRREKMLKNEHDISQTGIERIMPLLRSDGVLNLSNLIIDNDYTVQILAFFSQLRTHPLLQKSSIQKVIMDNVKIDQQDFLKILDCFQNVKTQAKYEFTQNFSENDRQIMFDKQFNITQQPNTVATNIISLTLSNIELTSELLQFIGINLLPQLYCLELTQINYVKTGKLKCFIEDLCCGLDDMHEDALLCLIRLKISCMDLSKQVDYLYKLIEKSQGSLVHIDFSWCNLNFQNLKDIFQMLITIGVQDAKQYKDDKVRGILRRLNLSYNPAHLIGETKKAKNKKKKGHTSLCGHESSSSDSDDKEELAVDQIDEIGDLFVFMIKGFFFKKLVHIDLSGINTMLPKDIIKILDLLGDAKYCPNLCAIHLNELNINFNEDIQDAITENFNIFWSKEIDSGDQGGLYNAMMTYLEKERGQDYRFKQADKFKYTDVIQKSINENELARRQHNLLNCIHMDLITKQKQGMASGAFTDCQGIGRSMHKGHGHDHFVIYKGSNLPELIFNQNPHQDQNVRKRYYEIDHFDQWLFSDNSNKKNSCFICRKQKYAIIFYERNAENNQDLFEIKDKEFIKKCQADYKLKYSLEKKTLQKIMTPLICGTVVTDRDQSIKFARTTTNPITNMTFDRKLRMVRADMFAFLSLSNNERIFKSQEEQSLVKNFIHQFLTSEFNARAEKMNLFQRLVGWNRLLHMKCFRNQIHQTHAINIPDCIKDAKAPQEQCGSNHYVFAVMLDPGYHQFIIYDPLINKAFCQEFILEPNNQWLQFPDLPAKLQSKQTKPLPPVFNKWVKDSIPRFEEAYYIDTSPYSEDGGKTLKDSFVPERFIKDPEEIEKCEVLLRENFDCIQTLYIDLIARSKNYPEIDLPNLQRFVLDITTMYSNVTLDYFAIDPAQIEVAFISATREDSPANRALGRGEFLEIIIRMADIKHRQAQEKQRIKNQGKFKNTVEFEKVTTLAKLSQQLKEQVASKMASQGDTSSMHTDSSFVDSDEEDDVVHIPIEKTKDQKQFSRFKFKEGDSDHGDDCCKYSDDSPKFIEMMKQETLDKAPPTSDNQSNPVNFQFSLKNAQTTLIEEQNPQHDQSDSNQQEEHCCKDDDFPKSPAKKSKDEKPKPVVEDFSWRQSDDMARMRSLHTRQYNMQMMQKHSLKYRRMNLLRFETIEVKQHKDVSSNLQGLLKHGLWVYHESSLITRGRKAIQQDPSVVRELAMRLKYLKKLFKKHCKHGKFTFDSALQLFEIGGTTKSTDFWKPLSSFDIWPVFVRCMMTIVNEHTNQNKYNHIVLVEFYEYVARLAFHYKEMRAQRNIQQQAKTNIKLFNYEIVAHFLDRLLERQFELGNIKKKKEDLDKEQSQ